MPDPNTNTEGKAGGLEREGETEAESLQRSRSRLSEEVTSTARQRIAVEVETTIEQTTETRKEELVQQTRTQLVRSINHSVEIPYEKIDEQEPSKMGFADIEQAIKTALQNGDIEKVLQLAFQLLFSDGNALEGLGYFVKGVEEIDEPGKADILEQIAAINQRSLSWQEKMKTVLLECNLEYALQKNGYKKQGYAKISRTEKVRENTTLRDYMTEGMWKEIQEQKLLGPLIHEGFLPKDTYLYFDTDNYPVYLGQTDGETPKVPMYTLTEGKEKEELQAESKLEYFASRLQPGDIVFGSQGEESESLKLKMVGVVGRMLQAKNKEDEQFHAIHALVYIGRNSEGEPMVTHVTEGGGQTVLLKNVMQNIGSGIRAYDALTAIRITDDTEKALRFAQEARQFVEKVTTFNQGRIVKKGAELFMQKSNLITPGMRAIMGMMAMRQEEKLPENTTICLDVVWEVARKLGIENMGEKTALEMFQTFNCVAAMNF